MYAAAVEQNGRNADGARTQYIEHVGVADVQCIIRDGIGALKRRLEELRIGLRAASLRRDDREIKERYQVMMAQNQAQAYPPVGDDTEGQLTLVERMQARQHVRVERIVARVVKGANCLLDAGVQLFRLVGETRTEHFGEVARPDAVDGGLIAPCPRLCLRHAT